MHVNIAFHVLPDTHPENYTYLIHSYYSFQSGSAVPSISTILVQIQVLSNTIFISQSFCRDSSFAVTKLIPFIPCGIVFKKMRVRSI